MGCPQFSVIMPVFNRAHTVEDSISSILRQTLNNFELIVVNDGSTDNTLSILKSITDPRVKIIDQKNTRQTQARRVAGLIAKGKYIAFCDSDDIWDEDYLEQCLSVFETYDTDVVFTNYRVQGESKPRIDLTDSNIINWLEDNSVSLGNCLYKFPDLYFSILKYQPIFSSSLTIRRSHYNSIGGISPTINNKDLGTVITSEDSHLIRRCSLTNGALFINSVLVTLGRQGDNTSHSYLSNLKGGKLILEDILNNTCLTDKQAKETRKSIKLHNKEIARQIYYYDPPQNYIMCYIKNYKSQFDFKCHLHFIMSVIKYFKFKIFRWRD